MNSSSSSSTFNHFNNYVQKNSLISIGKNSFHYIEPKIDDIYSYEIATDSNSNIRNYQISNSSSSSMKNKKFTLLKAKILAKKHILKKYNCNNEKYNIIIINNLLRNDYCHIVTIYKDILIAYSNLEFFIKKYNMKEIKELMKKFYPFYKCYFYFYCKPIFNKISVSIIMKHYYDIKAKCFVDDHKSSKPEEKTSKDNPINNDNKTIDSKNIIFNEKTKNDLDNVTIMTTVYDISKESTINLNLEREKVEIFRENKKDYSNDSTYVEIIDYIQNKNKNNLNKTNKDDNFKNKLKNNLLMNQRKLLKNLLKNKKNILDININDSFANKNKIPSSKLNNFLKKIKTHNVIQKINRNLLKKDLNKSIDHEKLDNNDAVNLNLYNNTIITDFSNIENKISQNTNSNNNINSIKTEKVNNNDNNSKQTKKSLKNIIINDYQNKESINNDNNKRIKFKKIFKNKNIKKFSKDNKITNQKNAAKSKKKLSRNKISVYQYIQEISSLNQKNENNSKKIKLSSFKTFIKNPSNNNNTNLSKIIAPIKKQNHVRHNTKFIKYKNIEKIFKNLCSKMKSHASTNSNNFCTNNNHNSKSIMFNTLTNDNNMMTDINSNSINTLNTFINIPTNTSINNTNLRKTIYNSIYYDRSYKSFKKIENEQSKLKIKSITNYNRLYKFNFKRNSVTNSNMNKSISLLNKTSENNNFYTKTNDIINKKSIKSLSKTKKNKKINRELSSSLHKKIKSIKLVKNNNSISNNKKLKININENALKYNKNLNTITTVNNRNYKSFQLFKIYNKIKKMNSNSINKKNISKNFDEKFLDKKPLISNIINYYIINTNFSFNSKSLKHRDNKKQIKNNYKKKNISKTEMDYSEFTNKNDNYEKKMKTFHNKSLSTYGVDLKYKKIMKYKM
jgi:hypothetical protein